VVQHLRPERTSLPAEQHIDAVGAAGVFWAGTGVTNIKIDGAPTRVIPQVNIVPKTAAAERCRIEDGAVPSGGGAGTAGGPEV
jgi:hypothetical protein